MRPFTSALTSACALVLLTACAQVSMPEPSEGAVFFAANCAGCHGMDAGGGQPADSWLTAQPPDLTRLTRRNGGTFPRALALSTIWGDPDQAHLARVMPQFGAVLPTDLIPVEVDGVQTPTPRALVALLAYLESVQR